MRYHNEKCQAWCKLDDATKHAIRVSRNPSYLENVGVWTEAACGELDGMIYRAPIIEKQLLEAEDIKQGDAIRKKGKGLWSMIDNSVAGVVTLFDRKHISFQELKEKYEIKSVGETEWRECIK